MTTQTELRQEPISVQQFFDSAQLAAEPVGRGGRKHLTADAAHALMSGSETRVPASVQRLLGAFPETVHAPILDSVLSGMEAYRRAHGCEADPTLVEQAIHNAAVVALNRGVDLVKGQETSQQGREQRAFDSATSAHHDQMGLMPSMAAASIMQQFSEAMPFAGYLPADIKSNEAKLFIMSNRANSDFGDYTANSSLDGVAGGGSYLDSERMIQLSASGGAGPFTTTLTDRNDGTGSPLKLLRGRTVVAINGVASAREISASGSGASTIAGSATIAGTTYNLGGTVNTDTGAVSITTSAALPAGVNVTLLAYVDFERAPDRAPLVGVEVTGYSIFARASRAVAKNSIDTMTQVPQEVNLDPRGQCLVSIRSQHAQERHYRGLAKLKLLAAAITDTWNYDYATQIAQKDRSQIWLNLQSILGGLSQRVANATSDHGLDILYMTGELAAQVRMLPSTLFESSGIANRPGIYRMGKLFGMYDSYYTPTGLTETGGGTTSQILAIGRATAVNRNPIIVGDAVPAIFLPVAMGTDMVQPDAYYARGFVEVNPHAPSALGCALVNVTNIK